MTRIAIFASGSGSNAENLICNITEGKVVLLLCNNPKAFVLERAKKHQVPSVVFTAGQLEQKGATTQQKSVLDILQAYQIDLILLAGFLWKIPQHVLDAFPERILNIHPALLPRYGGKGMYGNKVHEAVLSNLKSGRDVPAVENSTGTSGITIHLVDEHYDRGRILFQASCPVDRTDTVQTLAQKIHILEHRHFPQVVDQYIAGLKKPSATRRATT